MIFARLTWIPCWDWTDRPRHSRTLSFMLSISSFFCYLKFKSSCSKATWVFFTTELVIAAWLMNSIEIFFSRSDWQILAAWLTSFFDIFCAPHIRPYDLQTESNFYDLMQFWDQNLLTVFRPTVFFCSCVEVLARGLGTPTLVFFFFIL